MERTRRLALIGVLVASLATSVLAVAATPVSVTPAEGTAKTKFIVSFIVNREVNARSWLTVEAISPIREVTCEYQEEAHIVYAPKGRRVKVELRPVDKLSWCPGVYRGNIHISRRTGCSYNEIDEGSCYTRGPTVGRFRFTVTP